jgi:Rrf2 family transcriptional regulator, nitric oxide-sensitive transcriptional repressor
MTVRRRTGLKMHLMCIYHRPLKDASEMHIIFQQEANMRLTRYTDYSLRVLMYAAARGDQVSTIAEISSAYSISRDHLMKVVQELGRAGYLRNVRGRFGGILLARPANEIVVGEVVRHMEPDFELVDCGNCVISSLCILTGKIREALNAFMAVLDNCTLEDLLKRRGELLQLFTIESGSLPANSANPAN